MKAGAKAIIAKIPAREWRGLVPSWEGGRLHVGMECHICGVTDHWSASQMVGPESVVPRVIKIGWRVDGKLTCPACIAARRKKGDRKVLTMTSVTSPSSANFPKKENVVPISADAIKKNKRLVILALEDYFDEKKKSYKDSRSDRGIAEELGLSEGFVANVREEFYGKLAEPEEIAAFRSELSSLSELLERTSQNFTAMCTRNGWKV